MANVAKFDTSSGGSYVELSVGASTYTKLYVGIQVYRTAAQTAAQVLDSFQSLIYTASPGTHNVFLSAETDGSITSANTFSEPAGTFTSDTWHTFEYYWDLSIANSPVAIDSLTGTDNGSTHVGEHMDLIDIGASGATAASGSGFYIGQVKIGTGPGLGDILDEDWSGGTFANWTSNFGSPTIVAPPGADPPAFTSTLAPSATSSGGVSIAFANGPLDDPVSAWTRIDNLSGVHVTGISIDRGRGDERSKTNPGTATIKGYDTVGALDPTNSGSPFSPHILPVKQAAVTLFNPVTEDWHYLFRGYVDTYKYTLDPSEKWMEFEISLVDMLDMLNDAEIIPDQAGNTVPSESAGDCFYTGQHCDDRLLAVLSDASTAFMATTWPSSLLQIASGNVFVQGRVYARGTSLLQVIDEACDAEYPGSTNRFITKDGSFAFRGRYYRFVPAFYTASSDADRSVGHELVHWDVGDLAAYALDSTLAVYTGLEFELGKTDLINTCDVTPIGITDGQLASGSQFASDSTSITDYGPRTSGMSLENLITSTADDGNTGLQETATFATATVHNYKDPVTFVSQLTFKNPPEDGSSQERKTWAILCGLELSDLVTVTSTHPGGGGFAGVDHYVESIKYELAPLRGDIWNVTQTVGLSAKAHFTYTPASWNVPAVS